MSTNKNHLKRAVYTMFNDVIEQGYRQMINFPGEGDELNKIIKEATEELNHLTSKIDSHRLRIGSMELQNHYNDISKEVNSKSLTMLGQLQNIRNQVHTKT